MLRVSVDKNSVNVRQLVFHNEMLEQYPRSDNLRLLTHFILLPNLLYAELLSIFDCLTNFPSLPVRSGFDELFPVTTFLTVSQPHDTLASMFLYIT